MQEQTARMELSFRDYLAIVKRRANLLFWISAPILTLGVIIAFGSTPIYESTGTILFERAAVPDYLVRSTFSSLPDERVRLITQRVMSDDRLEDVLDKYRLYLYPELGSTELEAAELRRNLSVDTAERDIFLFSENTIAFTVTFGHPSAVVARDVAGELAALYLNENRLVQEELAEETAQFFSREAVRLGTEIASIEMLLAEFKREHADSLPEVSTVNLQLLDRTERDLEDADREYRNLRERRTLLESELAQLSPYAVIYNQAGAAILSPQDRLKLLQREYLQQSAIYSQDHPDVQRTRREIEALSNQTGIPGITAAILQAELNARRIELAAALETYSVDHPDVVQLMGVIANLQGAAFNAPDALGTAPAAAPPDNPAYIQKEVQLEGTRIELDAAVARRKELRLRLIDYEDRLLRTPEIERQYSSLSRGYTQLLQQYDDIEQKQREAQIASNLEAENKGERFTLLRSPTISAFPASPNRIAILLLAILLALTVSVGSIAIAEVSDTTVRGSRDFSMLLEIPPLAFIPYITNQNDIVSRRRKRVMVAVTVCAWAAATLFFVINPVTIG